MFMHSKDFIYTQILNSLDLKTKNGQAISFQCCEYSHMPGQEMYNKIIIKSVVDGQDTGYIKLAYIDSQWAQEHLKNTMDYFIYKSYDTQSPIFLAYQKQDFISLVRAFSKEINLSSEKINSLDQDCAQKYWTDIVQSLTNKHEHKFQEFKDYWINKPTIEMICVYTEKDQHSWDFSKFPAEKAERDNPKNWRSQKIGLALYSAAAKWCKMNGLQLWASTNQTENAKKMWQIMEKMPCFSIMMTTVNKYSSSGSLITNSQRPKMQFI